MLEKPETLIALLRLITGGTFALGAFLALWAWYFFQRSRHDAYWRFRRQAGRQGFRFIILAAFFLIISGAFCLTTLTVGYVENQEPASAAPLSDDVPPTATDLPTATASTPAPLSTATATLSVSPTPIGFSGRIEIYAIDDVVTDNWLPIQADDVFSANTQRLYFFYRYADIPADTVWEQVILKDGERFKERRQTWGITPPQGESLFFFGDDAGFPQGSYTAQIMVQSEVIAAATFTIRAD